MPFRIFRTAISLPLVFASLLSLPLRATQQPDQAPKTIVSMPPQELEQRLYKLETTQAQTIEALKASNDQYRWLITGVTALLTLIVFIQTALQIRSMSHQARREKEKDKDDQAGAEQVSGIMTVVQQTLANRLDAEKEWRGAAKKTKDELDNVLAHVKSLEQFYQNFQTTIKTARLTIEEKASRWASEVSRHDFRQMTNELNEFRHQAERFRTDFATLEKEPRPFSARVTYILGIAAHYANRPDAVKQYLTEVVSAQQPESGEPEIPYRRRVANAYYYLGLTESNFGNYRNALDSFERANKLDLQGTDYLTRIVTSEANIMANSLEGARHFLDEVEQGLETLERMEGRLRNNLRLRSRSILIKSSLIMFQGEPNWHIQAQRLLERVNSDEPHYYHATATLAQLHHVQGSSSQAKELFRQACESIESSGDLHTVTETRSRILLLMTAGMCCKNGLADQKRAQDYLDRADSLRSSLPKLGDQTCTVFSVLSRKNESSETIRAHVDLIRGGHVLLEPERRSSSATVS